MKKITALLLCFVLLCTGIQTVFAEEAKADQTNTVISTRVPDTHKITVIADHAEVFYEGVSGEEFTVGRLSEPRLLIRAETGKVIKSVVLNGEDVTEQLRDGYLTLAPVYEDKVITVTTADKPEAPRETYIVKGKVTLNGEPLADVDLELRSVLKTATTDEKGEFIFYQVEQGQHSLTALKDGKVIGYLSFTLQKDKKTEIILLEDGSYTVTVDQYGVGVDLHLMLSEDGVLVPAEAETIYKSDIPQTGDNSRLHLWVLLLLISTACIVVLETYRRKKVT